MTLILDAGTLFAQADADDPEHEAVVALFEAERGPLVTSQVAVVEADYLILTRLGLEVELVFLDDLAAGTFVVDCRCAAAPSPSFPRIPSCLRVTALLNAPCSFRHSPSGVPETG